MKRIIVVLIFSCVVLINAQSDENSNCLRCHGMKTLSKRIENTGGIKNLAVNKTLFDESHHGELVCTDCHSSDFESFPHPKESYEEFDCEDCHDNELDVKGVQLGKVSEAVNNSVHKELEFKCSTCHDPHTMAIKTSLNPKTTKLISANNQVCFDCHISDNEYQQKAELRDLLIVHNWTDLNSTKKQNIECISCHADQTNTISIHKIFSKK
ncbi:MAG: cytochrome c3 family protein [Melioribacteraceae bacterium]|nr:cytochrome c3 family protein [Melioribacteraceae bacterium]MCF8265547.1 cytochrome c3 family protein [Melioribacteraceae bacterium]MCF8413858.1 cytochrome c3 family protein [Melioribacteraceae bacterium]MCF8432042.1 cytochrome c3 family protein [Melioribacteraceae bacterium]